MKFTAPLKANSTKIMLLGSGELGKEVVIEAQRLGIETVAVDSYANAPAHLVANKAYVINMKNKDELLDVIRKEKPDFILPEVEAGSCNSSQANTRIFFRFIVLFTASAFGIT